MPEKEKERRDSGKNETSSVERSYSSNSAYLAKEHARASFLDEDEAFYTATDFEKQGKYFDAIRVMRQYDSQVETNMVNLARKARIGKYILRLSDLAGVRKKEETKIEKHIKRLKEELEQEGNITNKGDIRLQLVDLYLYEGKLFRAGWNNFVALINHTLNSYDDIHNAKRNASETKTLLGDLHAEEAAKKGKKYLIKHAEAGHQYYEAATHEKNVPEEEQERLYHKAMEQFKLAGWNPNKRVWENGSKGLYNYTSDAHMLTWVIEKNNQKKYNPKTLEHKVTSVVAVAGLLIGIFLFSTSITGNAIGPSNYAGNWLTIISFLAGLIGSAIYFNRKKK